MMMMKSTFSSSQACLPSFRRRYDSLHQRNSDFHKEALDHVGSSRAYRRGRFIFKQRAPRCYPFRPKPHRSGFRTSIGLPGKRPFSVRSPLKGRGTAADFEHPSPVRMERKASRSGHLLPKKERFCRSSSDLLVSFSDLRFLKQF